MATLGKTSITELTLLTPLAVAQGGTGATTFTSGAALIGSGTGAVTTRSITNMTSTNYITYNTNLMTTNTLAYWNGAYSSAGASNLTYCKHGAFGTAVTKAWTDSVTGTSTALVTAGAVNTALGSYLPLAGGTMTGKITMNTGTGLSMKYSSASTTGDPWIYLNGADSYGIRYFEGTPDKMAISASGNNSTTAGADLCINGNGDGTVTIRGKTIYHTGNLPAYPTLSSLGAAAASHTHTKSQITDFSHSHDYLPLSGGTLTDNDSAAEVLTLAAPNASYACIVYKPGTSKSWNVGSNTADQFYFYAASQSKVVSYISSDGSYSGNATTATKLATARKINDVSFDGTSDITIYSPFELPVVRLALSAKGWYRVASISSLGTMFNLSWNLSRDFANTNNEAYLISLAYAHQLPNFTQLNCSIQTQYLTKVRLITKSGSPHTSAAYLEVYYNGTVSNIVYSQLRGNGSSAIRFKTEAFTAGSIPDGYVAQEFELSTNPIKASTIEATATSASKLSTVSKTAWGQTYWTSGGVPTSISGDMSNVGVIKSTYAGQGTYLGSIKEGGALISTTFSSYGGIFNVNAKDGRIGMSAYPGSDNKLNFVYFNKATIDAGTNSPTSMMTWDGPTNNLTASKFTGNLTGNVTGNCSGSSGSCTGNAATATTATKVGNSFTIKLNGGTTEGTNLFTYNGSAAKTINITPSAIGASAIRQYTGTWVEGSASNGYWGNVIKLTTTTTGTVDTKVVFLVSSYYDATNNVPGNYAGILCFELRGSNKSSVTWARCRWLTRSRDYSGLIKATYAVEDGTLVVRFYTYTKGWSEVVSIKRLTEHSWNGAGPFTWTTYEGSSTPKVSTIPTTETAITFDDATILNPCTPASHTHTKSQITDFSHSHDYLPLSGGDLTGDVSFIMGDSDKFINWAYSTSSRIGASWRAGVLGSGSGDTNYFIIQSGTSTTGATTWNTVLRFGQNTFDAGFRGNVYPLLSTNTLGTSSLPWANVYATTFIGNLTGNVTGNCSGSAGSVAWTNVSGKPTKLSDFTADVGMVYGYGTTIPSNANINDETYQAVGIYCSSASTVSATIANAPYTSSGFRLVTLRDYGNKGDKAQSWGTQLAFTSGPIFWRSLGSNNENPGNWYQLPYLTSGTAIGSSTTPIYYSGSGTFTPCGSSLAVSITGNAATATSATSATTASKLSNTTAIGSTTKPVYFTSSGVPSPCTYSLNKTVPSTAVFTDTLPIFSYAADVTNSTTWMVSGESRTYVTNLVSSSALTIQINYSGDVDHYMLVKASTTTTITIGCTTTFIAPTKTFKLSSGQYIEFSIVRNTSGLVVLTSSEILTQQN